MLSSQREQRLLELLQFPVESLGIFQYQPQMDDTGEPSGEITTDKFHVRYGQEEGIEMKLLSFSISWKLKPKG